MNSISVSRNSKISMIWLLEKQLISVDLIFQHQAMREGIFPLMVPGHFSNHLPPILLPPMRTASVISLIIE